jgi:hypothetical protein
VSLGDTRYTVALEEMAECGYTVSTSLQEFIDRGGVLDDDPAKSEDKQGRAGQSERASS